MDPLALIEDYLSDNENGMKTLITWFLNQVMLLEALQQAGAEQYERTDARKAHRNGYKKLSLKTRYGETILLKPQFREFPFETQVFGRYSRVEKALENAIFRVFQPAGSRRLLLILASNNSLLLSVSRIAKDLDEQVHAFLQRPIEQEIPYLFVDASYYKVREGPRYITKALLVIAGVRMDGYREILGARITE